MEKIIELFIDKDNTALLGNLIKSGKTYYIVDYNRISKEFRVRIWKDNES